MSCVVQNSPAYMICSDVIYLHKIKYVTCQFYLPVSKFRLYHYKHFSKVTWLDYLKSKSKFGFRLNPETTNIFMQYQKIII